MLETVLATSTFSIKTEVGSASDPLSWERQQFPDSNSAKFSPIKQEVMDTSFDLDQTDFTELKPLPFDYGSTGLTGSLDPILNNNNNNTSNNNNNNNNKLADLYINIKPLSPHHFPFHPSPSDVTSSGSMSPQGMTKIDFSTDQNAFDDLANIVGLSVGADSTVPSLEGDVDLEALFENIKPLPLLLPGDSGSTAATGSSSVFDVQSSTAESSSSSSLLSNSISNQSLSNTQPYIGSLASLVKGSRMTIVEPRDSFPQNLSPILRGAITGGGGGGAGYHLSYPQLKFESMEMIKQEYYTQEQLPHSTVGSLADQHHHHQQQRRLGPDGCLIRSKPKPHKMKQRTLLGSAGSSPTGGNGLGGGGGGGNGGGDLSKKMMHHCQICNRGFLNKSNIKVHLRTHTGEKPFGCEHCSKAFRQKAHLLKHMSIHKRISRD